MAPLGRLRRVAGAVIGRRPPSVHDRARALAAARLDDLLEPEEGAWLDGHLAACRGCRGVAATYARQQGGLRAIRDEPVVPPRDLWARTAVAIEQEAAGDARRRRLSPGPAGAAIGVVGLAIVAGTTLLAPPVDLASPSTAADPSDPPAASYTPFPVQGGNVTFLALEPDGGLGLYVAEVDRACPSEAAPGCRLDGNRTAGIDLPSAPRSVLISPERGHLVVLGRDTAGAGGDITVHPMPTPEEPSKVPPTTPAEPVPSTEPGPSTEPTGPIDPTEPVEPTDPAPTAPTEPVEPLPSPTQAAALAIASGVIVRDESAAYSPDGRWFAFSAWPADGSHGPDIYLWRVGDARAEPATSDHRSVFASWLGNRILGSRVIEPDAAVPPSDESPAPSDESPAPGDAPIIGESFVLDPESLEEQPVDVAGGWAAGWRPVAAPNGRAVVYWHGTLDAGPELDWQPARGRVVLAQHTAGLAEPDPAPTDDTADPTATTDPTATSDPSARPSPTASGAAPASPTASPTDEPTEEPTDPTFVGDLSQVIATGPLGGLDVRWDPSGSRVAIWTADPATPQVGRLSLYEIRPSAPSGEVRPARVVLRNAPALAGFSITDSRLAWAVPPEADGAPNSIEVLAWSTEGGVGVVQTTARPGSLVIIR